MAIARIDFRIALLLRPVSLPIATGTAYYLAATISLYLTMSGIGIAGLWPSGGILLSALLVASPRYAGWHVAAAAAASILANVGTGNTGVAAVGIMVVAECRSKAACSASGCATEIGVFLVQSALRKVQCEAADASLLLANRSGAREDRRIGSWLGFCLDCGLARCSG